MDDTGLVHLEVDLTGLHFLDGIADLHGHGAGLGVRHETAGTEDTADLTDLGHHGRGADDHIHIGPAFLDLGDVVVQADIVGAGGLRLVLLVRGAEHQDADDLARSVRKGDDATDHLVGLARIHTEVGGDFHGRVELGIGDVLQQLARFLEAVNLALVILGKNGFLILGQLAHGSCV